MEEAEEAEPDEEFKDAIEVGGPYPAPSIDQARSWVVLVRVASHILSLDFKNSLIFSRETETCFELELTG